MTSESHRCSLLLSSLLIATSKRWRFDSPLPFSPRGVACLMNWQLGANLDLISAEVERCKRQAWSLRSGTRLSELETWRCITQNRHNKDFILTVSSVSGHYLDRTSSIQANSNSYNVSNVLR